MATERLTRYAIVDVRRSAGELTIEEYSDSQGRSTSVFTEAIAALQELTHHLPQQIGLYATGVSPLAVFVRGEAVDREVIAGVARLLGPFLDLDRIQLIALPRRDWKPRTFTLPLEVSYTKGASRSLKQFRTHDWPRRADVKEFGLKLHKIDMKSAGDVVFLDDAAQARTLSELPAGKRPRLIVASGFELSSSDPLLEDSSWLFVPEKKKLDPEFVNDILYGVVHDHPLHEVLKSASRKATAPRDAYLTADPASVNDLRMWDAMQNVAKEAIEIESRMPSPDLKSAIEKAIGSALPKSIASKLVKLEKATPVYEEARWRAGALRGNFQRERDALVPMARAREQFAKVLKAQQRLSALAAKNPKLRRQLSAMPRRVDVALMCAEPDPDRPLFVEKNTTLLPGVPYLLSVLIGYPVQVSLVVGDVPAIDPLLPPPPDEKGHLLHVVVYPLDFGPAQPIIQRLVLPVFGSSEAAMFAIETPRRTGAARLRIAVYYDADLATNAEPSPNCYHNHLLQSFILETVIAEQPQWQPNEVTTVRLEFSRTEGFAGLEHHGSRVASIAVNASSADTHTLMMKEGASTASLGISEPLMQKQLESVRASLYDATTVESGSAKPKPRFPEGVEKKDEFETAIRDLAHKGRDLRRKIFTAGSGDLDKMLDKIRESIDEVVQVVRLQNDFYFPWTILYDYVPPERVTGKPDAPVCDGFLRKHADGKPFSCNDCIANCMYPGVEKEAYCVYGFWGTRVQVEQSLHQLGKTEEAIRELKPFRDHCILYVSGLSSATALKFPQDLESELGEKWLGTLDPGMKLLSQLWSLDRPAVLVVLGHLQARDQDNEPEGPRIRVTSDDWLIATRVIDKADTGGRWKDDPHSVVILAACESAAADLLSMNDFINAFGSARAGAVIGTETSVFESLARRCARSLSKALLDGRKLGVAVLEFRRELLRERNPLGLVFTAFGHAGLQRVDGDQ